MRIKVLTIFPEMFSILTEYGVISRALKEGIVDFKAINLRDYTTDRHRTTDDYPYGGGSGLVMKAEPFLKAYEKIIRNEGKPHVILTSPQGKVFDNDKALELSTKDSLLFLCGRYEGVDERVMNIVDEELSIGDFVLSGGELPSMVMIESLLRFVPGVIGDMESVKRDSFFNDLLDYPHYTRPREIKGMKVPEVLLNGNHEEIELFRRKESIKRTLKRRPDLFLKHDFDRMDKKALLSLFRELIGDVE
ncbi:tRNA (guanine-N1)-methyltransferase [Kosmotoga arenicorallina S304]|uniref:tRNA (guanine-N(1)-)-methyltransferase n=1 Tax=Kosmotoga arenicorallina S304 TaxID=1453497 RepID=A0A182C7T1_9BACT|nr:tRNA (guanosine(37)-N1)-methyltransferase TrmD [Kosmotoga arenicorallina]OAA31384.1 tRNA (guanine-N1)-methyltransferase [Kosmotoga arenicorallina S304]